MQVHRISSDHVFNYSKHEARFPATQLNSPLWSPLVTTAVAVKMTTLENRSTVLMTAATDGKHMHKLWKACINE